MFNIVLFEPEIPPNTGNIIRLCAATGARLHLVEPLGFDFSDKQLRRAGLDYHEYAQTQIHKNWAEAKAALGLFGLNGENRCFAMTTKASTPCMNLVFQAGDTFLFGPETRGLPAEVLAEFTPAHRLRLPMLPDRRSLNLSNSVAIVVYEAWRQQGFVGGV